MALCTGVLYVEGGMEFWGGGIESDVYSWLSSFGVKWSEHEMDHPSASSRDEIFDG